MADVGLRLEKKGSGAVVYVGDTAVKASSIDRNFGLSKLCKRLGEFEPGDYAPTMKAPEPEPVSTIAEDIWRNYRKLRDTAAMEREEKERRDAVTLAQARAEHHEQRQRALAALARHGFSFLNIARHFLKVQQQEQMQALRAAQSERKSFRHSFRSWLNSSSKRLAGLWKFRRRIAPGMEAKPPAFPKIGNIASPYAAYSGILREKYPEQPDASRLDSMVALWMRVTGYTLQETAAEIHREAQARRKESRDWRDYAQRLVNYAYGVAGNIDIAAFRPTPEKIAAFHQEAERLEAARQAPEPQRSMFRVR